MFPGAPVYLPDAGNHRDARLVGCRRSTRRPIGMAYTVARAGERMAATFRRAQLKYLSRRDTQPAQFPNRDR
jgi:hypothetical protein